MTTGTVALPEALAREIHRVTVLLCNYEAIDNTKGLVRINTEPARLMINDALDEAFKAFGSGDVRDMMIALATLKGFED